MSASPYLASFTGVAAADLSADTGLIARTTGAAGGLPQIQRATVGTIAGAQVLCGMIMEGVADTVEVPILTLGETNIAIAGATITPGTHFRLTVQADTGRLVPAATTDQCVALFLGHRTAADGDRIHVAIVAGLKG